MWRWRKIMFIHKITSTCYTMASTDTWIPPIQSTSQPPASEPVKDEWTANKHDVFPPASSHFNVLKTNPERVTVNSYIYVHILCSMYTL
jgi:hypothetical protein